jgi:hypothetical protein
MCKRFRIQGLIRAYYGAQYWGLTPLSAHVMSVRGTGATYQLTFLRVAEGDPPKSRSYDENQSRARLVTYPL